MIEMMMGTSDRKPDPFLVGIRRDGNASRYFRKYSYSDGVFALVYETPIASAISTDDMISVNPDGEHVAVNDNAVLHIYKMGDSGFELVYSHTRPGRINGLEWSKEGDVLAVGNQASGAFESRQIAIVKGSDGFSEHPLISGASTISDQQSVWFSFDGKELYMRSGFTLRRYDSSGGLPYPYIEQRTIPTPNSYSSSTSEPAIHMSGEMAYISYSSTNVSRIATYDINENFDWTYRTNIIIPGSSPGRSQLRFSADFRYLAVASEFAGSSGVWTHYVYEVQEDGSLSQVHRRGKAGDNDPPARFVCWDSEGEYVFASGYESITEGPYYVGYSTRLMSRVQDGSFFNIPLSEVPEIMTAAEFYPRTHDYIQGAGK